uniref:Uncharacterized protein n=1 Tax=Mustela putorius furo TaxID=9669 RepID=M3YB59_MUSPF
MAGSPWAGPGGGKAASSQLMDTSQNLQPLPAIRQCIHGSLEVSTPAEPSLLHPELTEGTHRQAHRIVRGFSSTSSCRKGHLQEQPSCQPGGDGLGFRYPHDVLSWLLCPHWQKHLPHHWLQDSILLT